MILSIIQLICSGFLVGVFGSHEIESQKKCGSNGDQLKYLWGNALTDSPNCLGPNNLQYPSSIITRNFRKGNFYWGNARTARSSNVLDPFITQRALLKAHEISNSVNEITSRSGREFTQKDVCSGNPSRLCKTRYNTTAPMYGVSLTSGQPVTIVQKFPDLLQQVVYEVCESKDCEFVRGECTQTYVPYLFLVIPLGPVTLTGQDYVLVESGCVCKPKFSNNLETP